MPPARKSQTGRIRPWYPADALDENASAIPVSNTISSTGSARSAAASLVSSRKAANTGRGAWTTRRVRSHHSPTEASLASDDGCVEERLGGLDVHEGVTECIH